MHESIGHWNIVAGWLWMPLGILSGALLGLWSFGGPLPAPASHRRYDDLPRRLNRLAHVACFMLPLINILYGMHLDGLALDPGLKRLGSVCMLVLMVGIPVVLLLASFRLRFKYLAVIPVAAGLIGLLLMAWGQWLSR